MSTKILIFVLCFLFHWVTVAHSTDLMLPFEGGKSFKCGQGTYLDPDNTSANPNPTHNESNGGKLKFAIDFSLPSNTPVVAAKSGTVEYSGTNGAWGKMIRINYGTENGPSNIFGRYAHLNTLSVSVNNYVKQGQLIGYSGSTGNSSGPHLHYQLENYEGQSILPKFIDVVENNGTPLANNYYMSANHYTNITNFRVGWYTDGWKGTGNLPSSGFAPYSIIFSTAYYQNGGNDVRNTAKFCASGIADGFRYGQALCAGFSKICNWRWNKKLHLGYESIRQE